MVMLLSQCLLYAIFFIDAYDGLLSIVVSGHPVSRRLHNSLHRVGHCWEIIPREAVPSSVWSVGTYRAAVHNHCYVW
jgi:hypothetical protein